MIVIQSSADEPSTNDVLDWLYYIQNNVSIQRLNDTIPINGVSLFIGGNDDISNTISFDGGSLNISGIKSSWFRRGQFVIHPPATGNRLNHWRRLLLQDNAYILEYLDELIFPKKSAINKFNDVYINKLHSLSIAKQVGLSIPDTIITSNFSNLLQFADERKAIILKPLGTAFFEMPITERYSGHIVNKVSLVSYEQLKALEALYPDNSMQPTFVQQYVEKKWEVRSFFLKGTFYSMAIFSQQNEKTRIDFRNYDEEKPNRCLPFKLPIIIEEKLKSLMSILDMNCGSFDIIYTPEKEYVFLEVNPIGQYQWLDRHCNYFIDRHIANQLLQKEINE